jgi:uncharacterized protein (TIRG00374 family)
MTQQKTRSRWSKASVVFGLLLLAAVIFVAVNIGEGRKFLELTRHADPFWLAVGLGYQAATYFCAAGVWYLVLRRFKRKASLASLSLLGLAKLSIDKIIPAAGVGGSLLLINGLVRRGASSELATASLLVDVLSAHAARAIAVVASIILLIVYGGFDAAILVIVGLFALLALGISVPILWLTQPGQQYVPGWSRKIPGLKEIFQNIADAPDEAVRSRSLLAQATTLQLTVIVLDAATLDAMLRAIGHASSAGYVFASFTLAHVASTVSLIPGGLGAFEGVSVLVLGLLDVPVEAGLSATLLLRTLMLWLPMIPGFFVLRRETHSALAETRS